MQTELASMSASARLDELSIRDFVMDDDLNPGEQAELDRLQAWSETLAPHLTTSGDPETDELRRPTAPPRQRSYDDPGESRRHLEGQHTPLAKVPEPVDDDSGDGQN
jgi:hypothetical protein